jgi:hypothetical protein
VSIVKILITRLHARHLSGMKFQVPDNTHTNRIVTTEIVNYFICSCLYYFGLIFYAYTASFPAQNSLKKMEVFY